jgi:hypothetical protein
MEGRPRVSIEVTLQRHDVQVLGRMFQFVGQMEPVGGALDYLNDETRSTFPLYDVTISPLTPDGPLKRISRPDIVVGDNELGIVCFLDPDYCQSVALLKNFDRVIAYTPHAVLRGNFHRGAETRLTDLFDMMQGRFLAMTDVSVFPLIDLPAPFPQQADLIIVNRFHINVYHLE